MDASVTVALITGSFTIGGMFVKFYLDRKSKKLKLAEKDVPMFTEHQIFSRLEMLKNHIAMSFELANKGKEVVFKDLLINNIDIWRDIARELAEEFDQRSEETNDPIELYNLIMKHYERGMHRSSNYYKNNNYTSDEQDALDIVMSKFNKWNFPRMESTHETIRSICNSQFYNGDKVKAAVVLDILLSMLVDTINDAQLTLNEINGDMRGLVFRGVEI